MKRDRIRIGDYVTWDEAPGQFRRNAPGYVQSIKNGIASVSVYTDAEHLRKVPVVKLRKIEL